MKVEELKPGVIYEFHPWIHYTYSARPVCYIQYRSFIQNPKWYHFFNLLSGGKFLFLTEERVEKEVLKEASSLIQLKYGK